MSLLQIPLNQLTAEHLDSLRDNVVGEGRSIDYKEEIVGGRDEDKREFLADVSSFSNAGGGDIVFGIRERRDADDRPTGEPQEIVGLANVNRDAEVLRLLSLIRDGIAPRVQGVQREWIDRPGANPVLVLRIPQGWGGPHMVTFKNLSRFYSRNANGKFQLDVGEIRQAFLGGETRRAQLRAFRAERLGRIIAQETPVTVAPGAKLILHAMPMPDVDLFARIMALPFSDRIGALMPVRTGGGINEHYNLDGFVVSRPPSFDDTPYIQVFRTGYLEAVSEARTMKQGGGFYLAGSMVESDALEVFERWAGLLKRVEALAPIVVGLTVTGVRAHKMYQTEDPFLRAGAAIDRDMLVLDEVWIEDLTQPADVLLKPVLDLLWQAGGYTGSPYYGADGRRTRKV